MTLTRNETVVVLGPSGCGKTTLLRLIAGFERPDGGTIKIDDRLVSSGRCLVAPNRRNVGMIFQDLALWPHMNVFDNVAFGLRGKMRSKAGIAERVRHTLQSVALSGDEERFPHHLSGGEKQRLAIARGLAPQSRYLLMDEPFASLDPLLKREMMELLNSLRTTLDLAIVYVTHCLDEALSLADRIFLMHKGKIQQTLEKSHITELTREDLLTWYQEHLG